MGGLPDHQKAYRHLQKEDPDPEYLSPNGTAHDLKARHRCLDGWSCRVARGDQGMDPCQPYPCRVQDPYLCHVQAQDLSLGQVQGLYHAQVQYPCLALEPCLYPFQAPYLYRAKAQDLDP